MAAAPWCSPTSPKRPAPKTPWSRPSMRWKTRAMPPSAPRQWKSSWPGIPAACSRPKLSNRQSLPGMQPTSLPRPMSSPSAFCRSIPTTSARLLTAPMAGARAPQRAMLRPCPRRSRRPSADCSFCPGGRSRCRLPTPPLRGSRSRWQASSTARWALPRSRPRIMTPRGVSTASRSRPSRTICRTFTSSPWHSSRARRSTPLASGTQRAPSCLRARPGTKRQPPTSIATRARAIAFIAAARKAGRS